VTESVLEAPPPRFSPDEVAKIAAALFQLEGAAAAGTVPERGLSQKPLLGQPQQDSRCH